MKLIDRLALEYAVIPDPRIDACHVCEDAVKEAYVGGCKGALEVLLRYDLISQDAIDFFKNLDYDDKNPLHDDI